MLSFFQKKSSQPEFSLKPIEAPCIPYASHYDDTTLITKNGELMQVIKIEGYSEELFKDKEEKDLRAVIRSAILDNIKDTKVAIWFHTIRRKRNLDSVNYFYWAFARDTHQAWAQKNHWHDKFVNELYISILYDGENLNTKQNIFLSLQPGKLKKLHLNILEANLKKLNSFTEKMLEKLKVFGGKSLKIRQDRFGAHSEILEFLSKIICLNTKRVALPIQSIDNIFCRSKIVFGGNSIEVLDEKIKHYAAVFSIKEYHEFAAKSLDKFLRIPSEYVIAQTINFTSSTEAKKSFEYLNYILSVSKDEELRQHSGIAATINSDSGASTDYGEQQMTLMLIGSSIEELQMSVSSAVRELKKLGIVAIREDLHMALCFWSQLPGNFSFFRRSSYINSSRTASFASLHNVPSGKIESKWGSALTIFRGENGAAHFFNLHTNNNVGHTLVAGISDSAKNTLVNFILSESSKYDPNILFIDQTTSSQIVVKALGGKYQIIKIANDSNSFAMNPFLMTNTPENKRFLISWVLCLAYPEDNLNEKDIETVRVAVNNLLSKNKVTKKLSSLLSFLDNEELALKLKPWCDKNQFGSLFDNDRDDFDSGTRILGLNIAELSIPINACSITPFIMYALHRYAQTLDGSPTKIIINDANFLLGSSYLKPFLLNWLDYINSKNALAVFVCDVKNPIQTNIAEISSKFATNLFLPCTEPEKFQTQLNLSDSEVVAIKNMKLIHRHFMIKQNNEIVIVELNLDGLDYVISTLTAKPAAIAAMNKAIAEFGDNPNRWITPYYRNLMLK